MKKHLMLSFFIFLIISCSELNSINKARINKMLVKMDKNAKDLLNYPYKYDVSPSKNYILIYSIGCDSMEDEDIAVEIKIKKDIKFGKHLFSKGEYDWWFVYDIKGRRIIKKGKNLFLLKPVLWDETNNYLIFDTSTGYITDFDFCSLSVPEEKSFSIYTYYEGKGSLNFVYLFNKDSNFIAYLTVLKMDDFSGMTAESIGIGIKRIEDGKEIIISPEKENGFLELVDWKLGNEFAYREKGFQDTKTFLLKDFK